MPNAIHTVELPLSNEIIWHFLKDYNNWAPLIPGYIEHEAIHDTQFTWTLLADLGFTKKKIILQVDITDSVEPTDVKFNIKGLSDNFDGNGYFNIATGNNESTQVTGSLDLSAGGFMGMMINPVLESFVPKATSDLTNSIETKLTALHDVK
ncbi:CoxG family protein [Solibacillus sp. FSL K6-1126]|uniref:CoxG family protein n=1 Tax=Solibacillus sp. FSL K6-1126 TaxID=2921463 RepID=UPI0030FD1014